MAFDFLGTFTSRMWLSFKEFFFTVELTTLNSVQASSISYDPQKRTFTQAHVPGLRDHQVAESARFGKYFNRLNAAHLSRTTTSKDTSSNVSYPLQAETAFPYTGSSGTTVYEGFSPMPQINDFNIADKVLFLKTKVKKQIKSLFELNEYRLKRCLDAIEQIQEEHLEWDLINTSGNLLYNARAIVSQVESEFTQPRLNSSLLASTLDFNTNFDGEANPREEDGTQRIIYRGVLFKRSRIANSLATTSGTVSSTLDNLNKLFAIQNNDPSV